MQLSGGPFMPATPQGVRVIEPTKSNSGVAGAHVAGGGSDSAGPVQERVDKFCPVLCQEGSMVLQQVCRSEQRGGRVP